MGIVIIIDEGVQSASFPFRDRGARGSRLRRRARMDAAGVYFFLPEASCSTTMSSTYTFEGASAGGFFQS